jgi:hypothetical protein
VQNAILPADRLRTLGHELTLNYDGSDAFKVKSITAYRSMTERGSSDQSDSGPLLGLVRGATTPQRVSLYYAPLD